MRKKERLQCRHTERKPSLGGEKVSLVAVRQTDKIEEEGKRLLPVNSQKGAPWARTPVLSQFGFPPGRA